jgi:hypothetical protein
MLQNSGSVTTRINPPLSPAEREQRYQQVLRELGDPKFYQIRITGMLLKRGYLWPNERDDLNALRQAVILFISGTLRKTPKPNRKTEDKEHSTHGVDRCSSPSVGGGPGWRMAGNSAGGRLVRRATRYFVRHVGALHL